MNGTATCQARPTRDSARTYRDQMSIGEVRQTYAHERGQRIWNTRLGETQLRNHRDPPDYS
jgi:hypothetical protein